MVKNDIIRASRAIFLNAFIANLLSQLETANNISQLIYSPKRQKDLWRFDIRVLLIEDRASY